MRRLILFCENCESTIITSLPALKFSILEINMKVKRLFVFIAIMFIELGFLFSIIITLNARLAYFYAAMEIVSIIVSLYLVYSRDNPSFKLTWVIIILVFPLFGVFIYLIFGTHFLSPSIRKMIKKSELLNHQICRQDAKILAELEKESPSALRQCRFLLGTCGKPVYKGSYSEIQLPGEEIYASMLEELAKAKRFIFIEFFIIKEGQMWDGVLNILKKKAAEGVEIKIIYDDMGCIDRLASDFKEQCEKAGIKAVTFNQLIPVINKLMDYRDHRKIIVIDGNVGYTGGYNIGDEYINIERPYGHWYDGGIMLKGEAVFSFTAMFIDLWAMITGTVIKPDDYRVTEKCSDNGFVQPFNDSPFLSNVAEGAYLNMINSAKKYIYITSPYLINGHEMAATLCNAAKSGIDVRIITPHIPDKKFVFSVTHANYELLMENGVRIYEYTPGFMHAKMALSDGDTGMMGSVNLDYRSFFQQLEDAVFLYKTSSLVRMKAEFDKLFELSAEIELEKFKNRSFKEKFAEMFFSLFAPLI